MSRFSDAIEEFLEEYDMVYAEITMQVRRRELYRLCHVVDDLFARGMISTDDPSSMQVNDVKVIAAILKRDGGMSVNTRTHMLGRLGLLCRFKGNQVVDSAKVRYPSLFPAKVETRLGVLTGEEVRKVMEYAGRPDHDYRTLRSCCSVVLPLATGIRPQETRMLKDSNIDLEARLVTLEFVKGMDHYGEPRTVPILPDAVGIIARYLDAFHAKGKTGYIFQGPHGEPVSGNTQRKWRERFAEGSGVSLDHRILRRTWGQMLEDMGVPELDVSVLLGHASTATTARYYARVSERRAIESVRRTWAEMGSIVARAEADGEEKESMERERSHEGCEG